ncbi:hypothetical protein M433DRAFT_142438 [Acidomyces richmondensis BFW]|nr:hypothetical protein M433DRAFT_142438 [Acidomyces richmondensis BFW]
MLPIPNPQDYDVSLEHGFLPSEAPLERLRDRYYEPWEHVVKNLQGLILSKRLHQVVDRLPILSTNRLVGEPEWQRAYSLLGFIVHAYIWGGDRPMEWVPPPLTLPLMETCKHLELPPVATYAGLVLWNWKPVFPEERIDTLANIDMIDTFTGSLDEKWFYIVSVAIEARGAALIPLMLRAIEAARCDDRLTVTQCLRTFAERLDELGAMLMRMYDNCDPHAFYHRLRPFLAGSKNMADAGLPNGVVFDDGGPINKQRYVQFSGGSNAQSSLIQFFDVVLSIEHKPTEGRNNGEASAQKFGAPQQSFMQEMRMYMPGSHARFLEAVGRVANIRAFVEHRSFDRSLVVAFDACVAMLSAFRDKHIQIVSRYIIIPSKMKREQSAEGKMPANKIDLPVRPKSAAGGVQEQRDRKNLRGTGGTSLIPFLRQARDETGEPAVEAWAKCLISKGRCAGHKRRSSQSKTETYGLASVWHLDNTNGGLCLY